jgi:hypothetical protein
VSNKSGTKVRRETGYAITSVSRERARPGQLIKLWREHWHIENRLHWVRDMTFDEGRSQARIGHTPQVMAAFRNAAISLMRVLGATNIAASCRRYAARPDLVTSVIGLVSKERIDLEDYGYILDSRIQLCFNAHVALLRSLNYISSDDKNSPVFTASKPLIWKHHFCG